MSKYKTLVINLYGGPGTGKSTTAAAVFAELKMRGYNVELVTEYAKGMTWQKSAKVLKNQIYVFGKQHHYLTRPQNQVDVIVTDSPLLMSIVYDLENNELLRRLIKGEHNKMKNLDIYLTRNSPYQRAGRSQTEKQAKALDKTIHDVLVEYCEGKFHTIVADRKAIKNIVKLVEIENKKTQKAKNNLSKKKS